MLRSQCCGVSKVPGPQVLAVCLASEPLSMAVARLRAAALRQAPALAALLKTAPACRPVLFSARVCTADPVDIQNVNFRIVGKALAALLEKRPECRPVPSPILSDTMDLSICFRMSGPPHNRELNISVSDSKQ